MFASQVTDTVTVGNVIVTIRKLSWKSLRNAEQTAAENALAMMAKAGPTGEQTEAAAAKFREKRDSMTVEQKRIARYSLYDRGTVLVAGIRSWSNPDVAVTQKAIEDLEESPADQLHRAILDLSLPPIDAATEAAVQKND